MVNIVPIINLKVPNFIAARPSQPTVLESEDRHIYLPLQRTLGCQAKPFQPLKTSVKTISALQTWTGLGGGIRTHLFSKRSKN
jgi:hypothetical protein